MDRITLHRQKSNFLENDGAADRLLCSFYPRKAYVPNSLNWEHVKVKADNANFRKNEAAPAIAMLMNPTSTLKLLGQMRLWVIPCQV